MAKRSAKRVNVTRLDLNQSVARIVSAATGQRPPSGIASQKAPASKKPRSAKKR
jgi:hypothetical protein